MTFQRVLNRNRLQDGDYLSPPSQWSGNEEDRIRLLAGDLRRLEKDVVDENGICKYIAGRISIPEETVAAVLKEFVAF
jgi:hypothetical protein